MAPVILALEARNVDFALVMTGQHEETVRQLLDEFRIATIPIYIYQGKEITGVIQMVRWFVMSLRKCLSAGERFLPRSASGHDVVLVHGDTVSTLLGALVGRIKGVTVAHIEAGLRSNNILHPFPEELTRLAVSRLAHLGFCPGAWAWDNLEKYRIHRVDTRLNTLAETLQLALSEPRESLHAEPKLPAAYAVASIHRFENIFSKRRLEAIVELLRHAALHLPIVFVLHPATRKKLEKFELMQVLERASNIQLVPRMSYVPFIRLIQGSEFVITDGGSNQEELSYLGVPTLLMRKTTERQEGLGTTASVCDYDLERLEEFITNVAVRRVKSNAPEVSPSTIIVDELVAYFER
jgi:UDP-N-acetylglucosamine 2-epimerase (non-hydrolysing)